MDAELAQLSFWFGSSCFILWHSFRFTFFLFVISRLHDGLVFVCFYVFFSPVNRLCKRGTRIIGCCKFTNTYHIATHTHTHTHTRGREKERGFLFGGGGWGGVGGKGKQTKTIAMKRNN